MAKFKITINEVVNFNHEMVVEAENEFELEEVLDKIERKAKHIDDVDHFLGESGIKVLDFIEDGSGEVEIEIPDLDEIES